MNWPFRRKPVEIRVVHALSEKTLDRLERIKKIEMGWIRPKLPAPPPPKQQTEYEKAMEEWFRSLPDPIMASHMRALYDIWIGKREPMGTFTRVVAQETLSAAGAPLLVN